MRKVRGRDPAADAYRERQRDREEINLVDTLKTALGVQAELTRRLADLAEREHGVGCEQKNCDVCETIERARRALLV